MQDIESLVRIGNLAWWYVNGDMVDSGGGTARRAGQERACCTAGGAMAGDTGGATGAHDRTGADAGTGDGAQR